METNLYHELEDYRRAGIALMFNGCPSTSIKIATYVREEADYMRDYQIDQNQRVCGISFDKIKSKKH